MIRRRGRPHFSKVLVQLVVIVVVQLDSGQPSPSPRGVIAPGNDGGFELIREPVERATLNVRAEILDTDRVRREGVLGQRLPKRSLNRLPSDIDRYASRGYGRSRATLDQTSRRYWSNSSSSSSSIATLVSRSHSRGVK